MTPDPFESNALPPPDVKFDLTATDISDIEALPLYDLEENGSRSSDPQSRHIQRAERVVLGTLIATNGDTILPIPMVQLLNFAPDSFRDSRHREIARLLRDMKSSDTAIYPQAVSDRCEFDGADDYVSELVKSALSIDLASKEAATIWQAYRERRTTAVLSEAFETVAGAPALARSIAINVRKALSQLEDESVKDGLPDILDGAKLITTEAVLPDVLIEGMLHKGSKLSLGGSSKAYKSWTLLNVALSLSCGTDWLGFPCQRCRVLYVNFEIQPGFFHKRLDTLCLARMLFPEPGWLDIWNLRGYAAPHSVIIPKIIKRAKELGYGLIIIDPIYKLFDAHTDENSAVDIAHVFNSFEKITTETGASTAFGSHFAKGNAAAKEAIDRVSGSGVFARDPDTIINFTKHQEEDCFTVEVIHRNFAPTPPFVVKWEFPQFTRQNSLNPDDLKQPGGRPPKFNNDDLLRPLLVSPMTTTEWFNALKIELTISPSSFKDKKREFIAANKVLKIPNSSRWTLSLQEQTRLKSPSD
jgi:hypothetical protein